MKVIIIITRGDTIGGAQTHVFLLAKYLLYQGLDVLVVYGGEKTQLHSLLTAHNIPSCNVKTFKKEISFFSDIGAIRKLNEIVKSFQPDIVSLHSSKAGILGRIVARLNRIKNIVTVHGWSFSEGVSPNRSRVYRFLERITFSLTDKFILVSNYDLELAMTNGFRKIEKFSVIHNGIEVTRLPDLELQNSGIVKICMVARFDEQKDQQSLIRAAAHLNNIVIDFYGDGPRLAFCKDLARELQVEEKVIFHGFSTDVKSALQSADIFALISNWEGFPISTLEAMEAGLPVVVSDVGGAGECVVDGVNGFLVPRGDVDEITQRLKLMVCDPDLTKKMGTASRRIFVEKFTVQTMINQTLDIYGEVLRQS
jgi:glycosyltransferase involved in cell wall biosynthesis